MYDAKNNQDDKRTVYCPNDQQPIELTMAPGDQQTITHQPCGKNLRIERSKHGGNPTVITLVG